MSSCALVQTPHREYWNFVGNENDIQILATGLEGKKARPLMWVREQGRGRIFVSIPGHYTWTFDDPLFRLLLLRGISWTAQQPMNRLNDLATIGSRITTSERDASRLP